MIGKLKGKLVEIDGNIGLIETSGGVFYHSYLTPEILSRSRLSDVVEFYTYLHVKDDGLTLFAFEDKDKYRLFRLLLSVDGVGPRSAFTIISYTNAQEIIAAVQAQNSVFFSAIPGIGKKTAHKILLELSSKLGAEFSPRSYTLSKDEVTILEALQALGFDKRAGQKILSKLDEKRTIEDKITQAIKLLTEAP